MRAPRHRPQEESLHLLRELSMAEVSSAGSIIAELIGGKRVGGGFDYCHRELVLPEKGLQLSVLYDHRRECHIFLEARKGLTLEETIQGLTNTIPLRNLLLQRGFEMHASADTNAPWGANFVKMIPLRSLPEALKALVDGIKTISS